MVCLIQCGSAASWGLFTKREKIKEKREKSTINEIK